MNVASWRLCGEKRGLFRLKLHASCDAKWDAELSRNLRRWVGDDAGLRFDGSAGWEYVTSLRFGRVRVASDEPGLGPQPDWVEIERNAVLIV